MTLQAAIMYAVAAVLCAVGAGLLLALLRPGGGEARTYVYRMAGIMALAAGTVLAMSATAMWRWSAEG